MKNKLLTLGIVGITLLALLSIGIANSNNKNEDLMRGIMDNEMDSMKHMMNHMSGMTKMHDNMIKLMKENLNEISEIEEKQEMQEIIEHMENCPMTK